MGEVAWVKSIVAKGAKGGVNRVDGGKDEKARDCIDGGGFVEATATASNAVEEAEVGCHIKTAGSWLLPNQ